MIALTRDPSASRVLEGRRQPLELSLPLDVDVLVRIDENVADRRVAEQRLERSKPEHFVDDVGEEGFAIAHAERSALFGNQLEQQRADLAFGAGPIGGRQRLEIQPVEQLPVNVALELQIAGPRGGGGSGRCDAHRWSLYP